MLFYVIEAHFSINTLHKLLFISRTSDLKDICLLSITLFICLFPFCLDFVLFHEALLFLLCLNDLVYSYN